MPTTRWLRPDDPAEYVRGVLKVEAPEIPDALLAGPWSQIVLSLSDLRVNEAMVAEHDVNPIHRRRRDDFVDAIKKGVPLPPLIALGVRRDLVDGYARLRAARVLGVGDVEVIANDTEGHH